MGAIAKIDTSQLKLAFRAYRAATKKDEVDIVNRAARNIAFRASSFTPKGRPAKIRRDLMRDPHLRFALTSLALKKRGISKLKPPEFQKAVDALIARRMASSNYLRAGWAQAIADFGGTFKGSRLRGAGGFANKATTSRLIAEIVNTTAHSRQASVRGAELIGSDALAQAVKFVAEDMITFARQKMGFTAKQFSGKKK